MTRCIGGQDLFGRQITQVVAGSFIQLYTIVFIQLAVSLAVAKNPCKPMKSFSLDLAALSLEHRALLRAVHLCDQSLYGDTDDLNSAITLYLECWLPSLEKMESGEERWQPPPLNVAWVWHVHKLDPTNYAKDCNLWFGRTIAAPDGANPFQFAAVCNADNHPFNCSATNIKITDDTTDFRRRILGSAERQASLLWHLRWSEYDKATFLEESVDRYRMMLSLMGKHPHQFIVPTYDIDNIWHTHMAFPRHYLADCLRHAGRKVGHDDSDSDRSPGSRLRVCSAATERLWKEAFGCEWRKPGAMYRGPPPAWYFDDRAVAVTAAAAAGSRRLYPPASCAVTVVGCAFGAADEVRRWRRPGSRRGPAPSHSSAAGGQTLTHFCVHLSVYL